MILRKYLYEVIMCNDGIVSRESFTAPKPKKYPSATNENTPTLLLSFKKTFEKRNNEILSAVNAITDLIMIFPGSKPKYELYMCNKKNGTSKKK